MMKRQALAWLVVGTYVLGNTEAHQVFRLPLLVQHYQEHRLENPAVSLITFVVDHYILLHDSADKRHEALPFKAHDCVSSGVATLVPEVVGTPVVRPAEHCQTNLPPVFCFVYSSVYASIWQPPRVA
ncbi:MAG: hypothetical protein MUC38_15255 [Cyclobacteriaceae bacterium]|jgi:hypothetical protein|nr:hypothetical protein [Cyclobacteriaceae bacterium]